MIRCNAGLFRIVYAFVSAVETRYYLCGVNIEPHPVKGVILTATDGHRLFSAHDEHGTADRSAIIRLTPEALKACKAPRGETRTVMIGDHHTTAVVYASDDFATPLAISPDCVVDGTFPDWRRVVPAMPETPKSCALFDADLLTTFAKAASDLSALLIAPTKKATLEDPKPGVRAPIRIAVNDQASPALILFPRTPCAFGVLMPCNWQATPMPAWFAPAARLQAAE